MSAFRSSLHMPIWAGLVFVPILSYTLTNFVFALIPFLESLPEQGFTPYLASGACVLGLYFAYHDRDMGASICGTLCTTFGFLGTMIGFTEYLSVFQSQSSDIGGLMLAFVTTAHGLVCYAMIEFLMMWEPRNGDEVWDLSAHSLTDAEDWTHGT